jgi:hypothetical protein
MVIAPVLAPLPLDKVNVVEPVPGAATVVGLKLAEMPVGNWEVENATAPLKPPKAVVVIFVVAFAVEVTVTAVGLGASDSPGTLTVMVCV